MVAEDHSNDHREGGRDGDRCAFVLSSPAVSDSLRLFGLSPPSSSVRGMFQARVLERVAISCSGESSYPGTEPASPALQADSSPLSLGAALDRWERGDEGHRKASDLF